MLTVIEKIHAHSLCWIGDNVADLVSGWWVDPAGNRKSAGSYSAHEFDAALASPSGRFVGVCKRLGTKGLLIGRGHQRELNRSYYQAHEYEYPMAIFRAFDGRELLAHCPNAYNEICLEDLETGETLVSGKQDFDFFYSRLEASPSGRLLLSGGWYWHPIDALLVLDVQAMVSQPVDESWYVFRPWTHAMIASCTFVDDEKVLLTSSEFWTEPSEDYEWPELGERSIAVYDLAAKELVSVAPMEEDAGTLMAVGPNLAIGFYGHPKLIEISTGKVLRRWTEIESGEQLSSICRTVPVPPLAIDRVGKRFAVGTDGKLFIETEPWVY